MIVTCSTCSKQLVFAGTHRKRNLFARLFGWVLRGGRYFCQSCGGGE